MRNLLTILAFGLSFVPFSFYELEDPYLIHKNRIGESDNLNHPIEFLTVDSDLIDESDSDEDIHDYMFLYNSQTGYSIVFLSPWDVKTSESDTVGFFQGNGSTMYRLIGCICDNACCSYCCTCNRYEPKFYFVKESRNLNLNGFTEKLKGQSLLVNDRRGLYIESPTVELDRITTSSRVIVTNYNDIVTLSKPIKNFIGYNDDNYIRVNFKDVLKDWFDNSKELDFFNQTIVNAIIGENDSDIKKDSLIKNTYELLKVATKVSRMLDKKAQKLLDNSKILAVYGVFKGDDDKNSIVWGLAQDIHNPERRFHWITDLKDDISELIK